MDPVFQAGMILYFVQMILKSESIPSEKGVFYSAVSTGWRALCINTLVGSDVTGLQNTLGINIVTNNQRKILLLCLFLWFLVFSLLF